MVTTKISTTWGGCFNSGSSFDLGEYPFEFSAVISATTYIAPDHHNDVAWCVAGGYDTVTAPADVMLVRGATLTTAKNYWLNHYTIGILA